MITVREPTFNTALAEILRRKNPLWKRNNCVVAEGGGVLRGGGTPDILINTGSSMPVAIETEFLPARGVEKEARERVGRQLAKSGAKIEQCVALRAPLGIKKISAAKLDAEICKSKFEYCLFSAPENAQLPPLRWPHAGWLAGGVDDLAALIENAGISERLVAESLEVLEGAVDGAAAVLMRNAAEKPDVLKNISALLHQSENEQTTRMAMAIIANALTFQEVLAGKSNIKSIRQLFPARGKLSARGVEAEWDRIEKEINYYPIFHLARAVLHQIPTAAAAAVLAQLAEAAESIIDGGIASSHDLYGRMFQRLITDRKFLATFYTRPESAMLLAEIAVDMLGVNFAAKSSALKLRIADFACGTGTLLSAAYHAILARHRRAGHDDEKIHKEMMEKSLVGTDIMPAGVHLTASLLSSVHPGVIFEDTKVHTLPYGIEEGKTYLGALDLLEKQSSLDVLKTRKRLGGRGESAAQTVELEHESFDLVIMNPPFTRPTNHEITDRPVPSFAGFGTGDDEQKAMSARLQKINRNLGEHAGHGNAGLATNFIDLAHQKLKAGGVMAMVLPSTFAQGKSWENSRALVDKHYDDIYVISLASAGVNTTSFSADTAIAEILLVGKKRETPRAGGHARVRFVSLRKRPANSTQSAILASAICNSTNGVYAGVDYLGETLPGALFNGGAIGVLSAEVAATAMELETGVLSLPGSGKKHALPVTRLGEIAERQLLHRDISGLNPDKTPRGPFDIESKHEQFPTYPCLWAHHSELERRFRVAPDSQGRVRKGMQAEADAVWETASTLHFNLDFGLSANSLAACVTPSPTLGGTAWPNVHPLHPEHEPAIVLWANCTLGLLLWWYNGSRQQAGRARMTISKLPTLPILDTRKLTAAQHKTAARIFEKFQRKDFRAANEAYHCESRRALDRAVLVELLGLPESVLPPLDLLREKWCDEPSVHGGKKTRPQRNGA